MTIEETFESFFNNLIVNNEDDIFKKIKRIVKTLNKELYDIESETDHSYIIGSFGRDTAIKGVSDLDVIFALPEDLYYTYDAYTSNGQSALLQKIKSIIQTTYSQTDVRGDGQVIVIKFSGFTVELCPAFLEDDDTFTYPDSNDGGYWKTTKPLQENIAVQELNILSAETYVKLFHLSGFRCFKHFYLFYVQRHMQGEFPQTVSYNRFVELSQGVLVPMAIFLKTCCLGVCSGISFVDSTPIRVCHNKRIKRNKVFKGIAEVGKSTMGWFYGFKLHIVINDKGEVLNFAVTQANVDDREPLKNEGFLKAVFGKLFADKGYISEKLAKILFVGDVHLITSIRNNMRNSLMTMNDKIMLRKRSVIETVNDELKNICQVEHSRHRSFTNFITNIVAGLIAYSFLPKKPSITYQNVPSNQIVAF